MEDDAIAGKVHVPAFEPAADEQGDRSPAAGAGLGDQGELQGVGTGLARREDIGPRLGDPLEFRNPELARIEDAEPLFPLPRRPCGVQELLESVLVVADDEPAAPADPVDELVCACHGPVPG